MPRMPNIRRLWPFGRKQPQVSKVAVPKFRKYRQFKFEVDGEEHIIQSDYRNQAELNILTETWAKEQAKQLFPDAAKRNLTEVRDFSEPL